MTFPTVNRSSAAADISSELVDAYGTSSPSILTISISITITIIIIIIYNIVVTGRHGCVPLAAASKLLPSAATSTAPSEASKGERLDKQP